MATRKKREATQEYDVDLFQQFVSDPDLGQAIEALKRANDVFDILEPQETQHSQMLQWLLNPREGHSQGDAIFKDFLTEAWLKCEVEGGANADFFAHWTPARITMTGFHSVLLMREYRISEGNHLDFLIVDSVNRFVIVVENKYKAVHDDGQLSRYRKSMQQLKARHPHFEGYEVAFVALDRGRSRQLKLRELHTHWVYLDYSWLKAGASRAEAQLKRGNQSASLLISYCQRQSDYVSHAERDVDSLLAGLTREYRPLLKPLAQARATKLSKDQGLILGEPASDIWLFTQHYPELVTRLTRQKNLSFIKAEFEATNPGARFAFEMTDLWVQLFDEAWDDFTQADENDNYWWPFYLRVRMVPPAHLTAEELEESVENRYMVSVTYREQHVPKDKAARVHAAMVNTFPELGGNRRQNANLRRIAKQEVLESNLIAELQRRYRLLSIALQAA